MRFGRIITAACLNTPPPPDPRCNDPAFALANPDICGVQPRLVIKPGLAVLCEFGSIQFRAFENRNGIEVDVSEDTTWTSSDLNVLLIGVKTGNATAIAFGEVTVTAEYGDLSAAAQVSVLVGDDCCEDQTVAMLLMVDTTRSMSQVFGTSYRTKLDFARGAAERWVKAVNGAKDKVGIITFHKDETETISAITNDTNAVLAELPAISQTSDKTEFLTAIEEGIALLDAEAAHRKVLVIISDGQDTLTGTYNEDSDPLLPLADFKAAGGVVICLGVRAHGTGFALLSAMATGGFFINAYDAVVEDSLVWMTGLKGYLCAGNCTPIGDEIAYQGKVCYSSFRNWTVDGAVDLVGNGFFDFLPGNGLYVDLLSGTVCNVQVNGLMTTSGALNVTSGHGYRLAVTLGGNQSVDRDDDTVQVRLLDADTDAILLSKTISVAYDQGFLRTSFNFTADQDRNVKITVQQINPPDAASAGGTAGALFGELEFTDTTTLENLLFDNFDVENPVYVPPRCGTGTYYAWLPYYQYYGYGTGSACNSYDDCLVDPPGIQQPDPSPLTDIESGSAPPPPPVFYNTAQEGCASCESGVHLVSAVPALTEETNDTGEAIASNEAAGWPAWYLFKGLPFSDNGWNPGADNDCPQWAGFHFNQAAIIAAYGIFFQCWNEEMGPMDIVFQGSNDGVTWTDLDEQTVYVSCSPQPGGFDKYEIASPASYTYYRIYWPASTNNTGKSPMLVRMALYTGAENNEICVTVAAGQYTGKTQTEANQKARDAAVVLAEAQLECQPAYTATENYTARCSIVHPGTLGPDVTRSATVRSLISAADAQSRALALAKQLAEDALVCTSSNNEQAILINSYDGSNPETGKATPWPSVKYVSATGLIVAVKVHIYGVSHTSPSDVIMILVSPTGVAVPLMQRCGGPAGGNAVSGIDLTFDDTGAALPEVGLITEGTYRPTQYGADLPTEYIPAMVGAYQTTLAAFSGSRTGSWSLWVFDAVSLDTGSIANGWDIEFD